jgi:predicted adenine nucleotide alpha hydrolase (AANH) superfamily ATPase
MQPQESASPPAENAILLHACCGPCSIMSILLLRDLGLAPTLFFYNPNIHPLSEYLRRREGLLAVAARLDVPVLCADESDPAAAHPGPWLEAMAALGPGMDDMARRCPRCYDLRFALAASTARSQGFAQFTSTLLYSRYQNRKAILESGARHAGAGLAFLAEDFRPGLLEGVRLSKEWGIYRQQYCGCMLSEHERYTRLLLEATARPATSKP